MVQGQMHVIVYLDEAAGEMKPWETRHEPSQQELP